MITLHLLLTLTLAVPLAPVDASDLSTADDNGHDSHPVFRGRSLERRSRRLDTTKIKVRDNGSCSPGGRKSRSCSRKCKSKSPGGQLNCKNECMAIVCGVGGSGGNAICSNHGSGTESSATNSTANPSSATKPTITSTKTENSSSSGYGMITTSTKTTGYD
jgi:hypothetical protein